jgi:hypothetical protein
VALNMKALRSSEVSENTDDRAGSDPRWCGEVLTVGECSRTAVGRNDRLSSATNHRMKHKAFRVACSGRVDCKNACRRASGNSTFQHEILGMGICRIPNRDHLFGGELCLRIDKASRPKILGLQPNRR